MNVIAGHTLPFGLLGNEMVRPEAVPNGKACGCICPECKSSLVAKNAGQKVRPHFAHTAGMGSELCGETAMHLMAKQVLTRSHQLVLPKWERRHSERDISGQPHHCVDGSNQNRGSGALRRDAAALHAACPMTVGLIDRDRALPV